MKFTHILAASAALLSAAGLCAQTTTTNTTDTSQPMAAQPVMTQNSNVPAPNQTSMSNMSPPRWEADVTAPYAFRLKTTGISADIGGDVAPGNFLGFEYTYFHPKGTTYDPVAGSINSTENISTYQIAYRYRMPLTQFAMNGQPSPVDFYAGVSGGFSDVRLKTYVPAFGFRNQSTDNGAPSAEGSAGLEWNFNANLGLKVGYKYIYLHRVNLYGQTGNIDSSVVEAGLNFRW